MKNGNALKGAIAALGMIILISDPETALKGAADGITSCINTVIPSLFPFILLNCWLNDQLTGEDNWIPVRIIRAAGLPKGTVTILVSAVLGGYPTGAQAVHTAYSSGVINKTVAERILAYTNNAGPAFIFGMLGHVFPSRAAPWLLWGIHILSAFIVRLILAPSWRSIYSETYSANKHGDIPHTTAKIMCTICIWVTTFRIIVTYLGIWIDMVVTPALKTMLFGSLELVNGCCILPEISDLGIRFIVCSGMLAFGGLCVTMQTLSVVRGLDIRYYLIGKSLQTVISIILSTAFVSKKPYMIVAAFALILFFFLRIKKSGKKFRIRV